MRFVPPAEGSGTPGQNEQLVWIRATQPLPDEPLLHVCALAYASDLSLASTAALDLQEPPPIRTATLRVRLVSLDHAMWFHRPFRADNWLLFATRSRTAGDGRGLATGEFFARDGLLVASVTQEALLRPIAEPRKA
jgi:acyl-CoA thioesterase-2